MDEQARLTPLADAAFSRFLTDASGVLVAVSGGPDSMALLALLVDWRGRVAPDLPLAAATVDHGLRAASTDEAANVAAFCHRIGVPHATLAWTGDKPASGLQEAARSARYRLLSTHALERGMSHLAVAHHSDDQAETVLLRLCAGSGISGLGAMRERTALDGVTLMRPLLHLSKAALVRYCQDRLLPFVDDPSNRDERFGRSRLRQIMPLLAREGLGPERLTKLAERATRADAALAQVSDAVFARALLKQSECLLRLDWRLVAGEPEEIRLRVLMHALRDAVDLPGVLQLDGCERLLDALSDAHGTGLRLRRTLAGRMITLLSGGILTVALAPPRK